MRAIHEEDRRSWMEELPNEGAFRDEGEVYRERKRYTRRRSSTLIR